MLVFILRGLSASARVLCPAWTSHKLGPAPQLGSRPAAPVDGDDLLHQELPVSVLAVRQHRIHDPRHPLPDPAPQPVRPALHRKISKTF